MTALVTAPALPVKVSGAETTLKEPWSPSALVFMEEAATGEEDDVETTTACSSPTAGTGSTVTGLDEIPWALEDVSAWGVDSTLRESAVSGAEQVILSCVSLRDAFASCSRANLICKTE